MDERVIHHAKRFITNLDRDKLLADSTNKTETLIEEATKRLDKADADLAKNEKEVKKLKDEIMRALLGESTFPQATLSEMLKAKETERLDLLAKQESAQEHIFQLEAELTVQKDFVHEFDDWEAKFDRASTGDKKSMLLNIIDRIDVYGDEVEVTFKVEFSPLLHKNTADNITPLEFTPNGDNTTEYTLLNSGIGGSHETTPETTLSLYPSAVKRYDLAQIKTSKK